MGIQDDGASEGDSPEDEPAHGDPAGFVPPAAPMTARPAPKPQDKPVSTAAGAGRIVAHSLGYLTLSGMVVGICTVIILRVVAGSADELPGFYVDAAVLCAVLGAVMGAVCGVIAGLFLLAMAASVAGDQFAARSTGAVVYALTLGLLASLTILPAPYCAILAAVGVVHGALLTPRIITARPKRVIR